jgi:hypothetical protein
MQLQLFIRIGFDNKTKVFYDPNVLDWSVEILRLQIFAKGLLKDYPLLTPNRIFLIYQGKVITNALESKVSELGIEKYSTLHLQIREMPQIYVKFNCRWINYNFFYSCQLNRFPSRKVKKLKEKIATYLQLQTPNSLIIKDSNGNIIEDTKRIVDILGNNCGMGCDLWVSSLL